MNIFLVRSESAPSDNNVVINGVKMIKVALFTPTQTKGLDRASRRVVKLSNSVKLLIPVDVFNMALTGISGLDFIDACNRNGGLSYIIDDMAAIYGSVRSNSSSYTDDVYNNLYEIFFNSGHTFETINMDTPEYLNDLASDLLKDYLAFCTKHEERFVSMIVPIVFLPVVFDQLYNDDGFDDLITSTPYPFAFQKTTDFFDNDYKRKALYDDTVTIQDTENNHVRIYNANLLREISDLSNGFQHIATEPLINSSLDEFKMSMLSVRDLLVNNGHKRSIEGIWYSLNNTDISQVVTLTSLCCSEITLVGVDIKKEIQ